MSRSNFDVYAEAARLIAALTEYGHTDWSERLSNSIAGGATSGEILTYLAVDLDALTAEQLAVPDATTELIAKLRLEIARAMRGKYYAG